MSQGDLSLHLDLHSYVTKEFATLISIVKMDAQINDVVRYHISKLTQTTLLFNSQIYHY